MKRLALYTAVVLITLSIVAILARFPSAIVMLLLSIAIASAARPMVDMLVQRGVWRTLAIIITYLAIVGVLLIIIIGAGERLLAELSIIGNALSLGYDRIWSEWPHGTQLQQTIIQQLPTPEALYGAITGEQGMVLTQTFLGITSSSLAIISQFLAVLVLSVYWTIDRVHFERVLLSLLSVEIRARSRRVWREIEDDLGAYIRSEILQSLLAGMLLGLGFSLMGLPYPTLLATFGALAWLIPWLGAAMAVIPAFLVGLLVGLPMAVAAAIFTVSVLLAMELVVEPRLFPRRQYTAWLSILFIMALGDAFGLVGVIAAPLVATVVQIMLQRIFRPGSAALPIAPEIESARQIAHLDERIAAIRSLIEKMEDKPSQQTVSMLDRLDQLVGKANQMIQEENSPASTNRP